MLLGIKICIGIIVILLMIFTLHNIALSLYCARQKNKTNKKKYTQIQNKNTNISNMNSLKNIIGGYLSGYLNYCILRLGKVPSQRYRNFMLRKVFKMGLDKKTVIYGGFEIRCPWNITVGEGTIIGNEVKLDGRNGIIIGKNVNFSTGVWIWTEQHDHNDEYFRCLDKGGMVIIGDRAWISCRTIILPNVIIGEGAVLAAGAVAVNKLDSYGIYTGCPAKKVKERSHNLRYEFDGKYRPFY